MLVAWVPLAHAQSDGDGPAPKKHYLSFQIGFRGSAEKTSEDAMGHSETRVNVNNSFTGEVEVRPEESYDLPKIQSEAAAAAYMAQMAAAVASGDADKMKAATPASVVTWVPVGDQVEITGKIEETMTSTATSIGMGEHRASRDDRIESYRGHKVSAGNLVNASVKIHAEERTYDLQFMLMPDMETTMEAMTQSIIKSHREEGNNHDSNTEAKVSLDMGPGQLALGYSNYLMTAEVKGLPLAGDANHLIGFTRIPVPKPDGWVGVWDVGLEASWQLDFTLPPVEVVLTVPGYENWRPVGSIKEPTTPGNDLLVRATLKPRGTEPLEYMPKVKSFRFELLETSREPGVCLNWPVNADDTDFDLRLAAAPRFPARLSANGQKNEIDQTLKDDEGWSFAESQLDSYDFGGRAMLKVVCKLEDGREIAGRMKEAAEGQDVVYLPKRAPNDWIAESWRTAKHAKETAADADEENAPIGDGSKGDGLTLYEEYRGWSEDGTHIEGDPKTKDFFLQVKHAGFALPGIAKFQRLTGLVVHYRFTESEFPKLRIMNSNRDHGPTVTKQHGVIVQVKVGQSGVSNTAGGPGKPEDILSVDLGDDLEGLPASYVAATVAHELGHSVNLWHHGDGDYEVVWAVRENKLYEGKEGVLVGEIFVVNEQRQNLTPAIIAQVLDVQAQGEAEVEGGLERSSFFRVRMAVDQGQHSGVENCIMRYDDAQTYKDRRQQSVRFWHFVEPVGAGLCKTGVGSGVNDKDRHVPQSRYGPALKGRGDCFHQIHVTDAVPAQWRFKDPRPSNP